MIIKVKLFWKIFIIFFAILSIYIFIQNYQRMSFFYFIFILLFVIMLTFGSIFVFPTLKVTFDDKGFRKYWKISIGEKIYYEKNNLYLRYDEIKNVSSFLPSWFPIHLVYVSGYGDDLLLEGMFTNEGKALAILAKKVNPNVMDKSSRKILKKYEKKYKDRISI